MACRSSRPIIILAHPPGRGKCPAMGLRWTGFPLSMIGRRTYFRNAAMEAKRKLLEIAHRLRATAEAMPGGDHTQLDRDSRERFALAIEPEIVHLNRVADALVDNF